MNHRGCIFIGLSLSRVQLEEIIFNKMSRRRRITVNDNYSSTSSSSSSFVWRERSSLKPKRSSSIRCNEPLSMVLDLTSTDTNCFLFVFFSFVFESFLDLNDMKQKCSFSLVYSKFVQFVILVVAENSSSVSRKSIVQHHWICSWRPIIVHVLSSIKMIRPRFLFN